jgi:hypothetical protein
MLQQAVYRAREIPRTFMKSDNSAFLLADPHISNMQKQPFISVNHNVLAETKWH